jgi:hypothetical protein
MNNNVNLSIVHKKHKNIPKSLKSFIYESVGDHFYSEIELHIDGMPSIYIYQPKTIVVFVSIWICPLS